MVNDVLKRLNHGFFKISYEENSFEIIPIHIVFTSWNVIKNFTAKFSLSFYLLFQSCRQHATSLANINFRIVRTRNNTNTGTNIKFGFCLVWTSFGRVEERGRPLTTRLREHRSYLRQTKPGRKFLITFQLVTRIWIVILRNLFSVNKNVFHGESLCLLSPLNVCLRHDTFLK